MGLKANMSMSRQEGALKEARIDPGARYQSFEKTSPQKQLHMQTVGKPGRYLPKLFHEGISSRDQNESFTKRAETV